MDSQEGEDEPMEAKTIQVYLQTNGGQPFTHPANLR